MSHHKFPMGNGDVFWFDSNRGAFKPLIEEMLKSDKQAQPKQRHTVAQRFRILQHRHGYPGGYDQVRRHGRQRRREKPQEIDEKDRECVGPGAQSQYNRRMGRERRASRAK